MPSGWKEVAGGQFLVAKFMIAGDGGAQAAVNVSTSAGDGGGLAALHFLIDFRDIKGRDLSGLGLALDLRGAGLRNGQNLLHYFGGEIKIYGKLGFG